MRKSGLPLCVLCDKMREERLIYEKTLFMERKLFAAERMK